MKPIIIGEEIGLSYKLDLQEGSVLYTPAPNSTSGKMPISIVSYGYFVAGPEHFTERHDTKQLLQIFITHRGRGRFIVNGREFIARPGSICLLNFEQSHRYEAYQGTWEHEWVNFTGSACGIYDKLINPDGFQLYSVEKYPGASSLMREIRKGAMKQEVLEYVHNTTRILRLLDGIYTLRVMQQRDRLDNLQGKVMLSAEYMQTHYMERLTLDQLAQISYLSKYYYARAFKQYLGLSPYEYLNAVRLSQARNLLISSTLTVDQIGWQTGFGGAKNLIRAFRKAWNITPGEFRQSPP